MYGKAVGGRPACTPRAAPVVWFLAVLLLLAAPLSAQNNTPILRLLKLDDVPNVAEVEAQVIFTLELWNKGTGPARDVVVRDWLNPDWFTDILEEDCGTVTGPDILWDGRGAQPMCPPLQSLMESPWLPSASYSFRVTVRVTVADGTEVCNQATVEAKNFNDQVPILSDDPDEGGASDPTCFYIIVPPEKDSDGDGLADMGELELGLDPYDGDTDDDGVLDGEERRLGLDPFVCDTDGDTLPDGLELGKTEPLSDTHVDNDCYQPDLDPNSKTDPLDPDTDGDGLTDGCEDANRNGRVDPDETNPLWTDTDRDGLPDGCEDLNHNCIQDPGETDPRDSDSDDDGLSDGCEDKNGNCVFEPGGLDGDTETCLDNETNPLEVDTDGDGRDDFEEIGADCQCDPGDTNPVIPEWGFLRTLEIPVVDQETGTIIYPDCLTLGVDPAITRPTATYFPIYVGFPIAGDLTDGNDLILYEAGEMSAEIRLVKVLPSDVRIDW